MSTNRDSIRIKRGMSAELPESLPLGELAFCIDTRELWVGSGEGLALKRVTNTEITQHLEEWNLLYTEVDERFETKYHDVTTQFQEKFLDLSEQFSDKYADLNKQFSDKFEEICVQFSTKYNKLEEHYAQDLHDNKLSIQQNRESIDLLKRDIGTTENIEDLREINNQATETLEQLNAVKEELQNDVLVIKDIEKDLQKASVDYSGEHHENLKDSMDANVDFILGEFNSTNMTGEHITAHNTIQRHIKNAELKGHTEVNYIKDPSDKDLVMPYPFDDAQSIKLSDTKDTGSLNIVLKGNTEVNVLKNPMRDYVVPYEFEEGYTATLTDTKETGSIQSAILKGNTLVNLMTKCKDEYVVRYHDINNPNNNVANFSMMKPNTEYTLFYKAKYRTEGDGAGTVGTLKIATSIEQGFIGTSQSYTTEYEQYVYKITTSSVVDCFVFSSTGKYFAIKECILLEGDYTNVDIPFFEGMTSVKAPVLHSVGKNLYNPNTAYVVGINNQDVNNKVDVKANTEYTFYANGRGWTQVILYNNKGQKTRQLGQSSTSTKVIFTTTNDEVKATLGFYYGSDTVIENVDFTGIQLEYGAESTSYEPYKSNILTVNEDVELRGIGDVKDTLDLLTGQVTQRIGEIVLDGSENWSWGINNDGGCRFDLVIPTMHKYPSSGGNPVGEMLSNYLPVGGFTISKTYDKLITTWENRIVLYLGMDITTTKELKEYLSQNPLTVQYKLATESIKTVDLSILDQDGLSVPALSTYNEVTYINTTVPENSLKPLISSKTPEFPVMIKPNTKYSIVADTTTNGFDEIPLTYNLGGAEVETSVGEKLTVIQTPRTLENETFKVTGTGMKLSNVMILEKDLTGKEIPNYTEGMQSVKMPGLMTTGKNLLNPSLIKINMTLGSDGITEAGFDGRATTDFISIKPNTAYAFGGNGSGDYYYVEYDFSKNPIDARKSTSQTFTSTSNTHWVRFFRYSIIDTGLLSSVSEVEYSLEESSSATSYEPYQTNILTVNEDVTLRGVGDVQDTLDLMTGEVVERVGEVVLDGSENWTYEPTYTNENVYGCYILLPHLSPPPKPSNFNFANNVFPNITNSSYQSEGFATNPGTLSLRIAKDKLETVDLSGFKKYLQNNPVTLQYPLATESVKTVDFTITNQNGAKVTKLSTFNDVTYISTTVAEGALNPIISHKDLEYEVLLKPNTKYSIITNPISNKHPNSPISFDLGGQQVETTVGSYCTLVTTPSTLTHEKLIFSEGVGHKLQGGVMVLEGDKTGMVFSHFDGMKSVENPTVRVNNENLFDVRCRINMPNKTWFIVRAFNRGSYTFNSNTEIPYIEFYGCNEADKGIQYSNWKVLATFRGQTTGTFQLSGGYAYIIVAFDKSTQPTEKQLANITLVCGANGKDIPHQSNSLPLTVPMRSLPNGTCDTLNLLTGEYVQNVGEIVIDGTENWNKHTFAVQQGDIVRWQIRIPNSMPNAHSWCDKMISYSNGDRYNTDYVRCSTDILWIYQADTTLTREQFIGKLQSISPITIQYELAEPIVTKLDLQWEDGKLFAYDGITHFFVDVDGGHLQPVLDIDVPTDIVAELSRLRAEKEQLETSKAQLENQLEVITYRNTNLQSNLDSLVAENQDLKLQTYDLQTRSNVLQLKNKEMTKHQEKLQAENLELQKRASELAQTTMNLTEELHVVDSVRETGDLELLSSDFELDFRLMEIEFALDIPISLSVKGVSSMARTPFEMAKTLILGGKYEREDMEKKLKVYRDRGKITVEEYDELVALMDAYELA